MENFTMSKIHFTDFLGLDVTYREIIKNEDADYELEKNVKSGIQRHSDIDNLRDKFKIHLAKSFGLLMVGLYKPESDMNDQEKEILEMLLEKVRVTKLIISGADDNRSVMIVGSRDMFGKRANLITCNINIDNDNDYEGWKELNGLVAEVESEAYEYLFKRKFAQLDLFSADGVTEEESKDDFFRSANVDKVEKTA